MTRAAAVVLVQKIMDMDYAEDAEAYGVLEALDRALGCPTGYVSDLIFWPKGPEPTAAEVVDQALEYRPFAG
ncbi:e9imm peptide [Kitasatospora sp. NA04385]|uniref:e9imm peptide n=1 Tax=Kitasatospora sp. NA04385 TaxID=2742135 RepID=UPI001590FA63|nr:e9imm peptide [Kitasatospora sp. NA04385]QKW24103.1 e9imm peptide [Kitasatospora sp. NA04385]